VQDVPGVVDREEKHAAARVRRPGHIEDLLLGGRGEHAPTGGPVPEASPDPSGEGREVPGAATHHDRHLAFGGSLSANDPALDEGNPVCVERGELGERLGGEVVWIIEQLGHGGFASQETGDAPDRAPASRLRILDRYRPRYF
jgi:hypothetical protein